MGCTHSTAPRFSALLTFAIHGLFSFSFYIYLLERQKSESESASPHWWATHMSAEAGVRSG